MVREFLSTQALSIGKGYEALGGRLREKVSQNFSSALGLQKVGNDSYHHLKIFGEVSKPLKCRNE